MTSLRKALLTGMGLAALAPARAPAQQITGAGSTLAQPVYQKWADVSQATTGISLNYQGVGSGAGQKLIFAHEVDFGASDAPVPSAKLVQNKLVQFPTVIGAVDIAVNLPGIASDQLRLDGPTLAAIYMGTITKWNDPTIAKMNHGVKLPDIAIAPVYRADGSGTTYVFTDYLAMVSPEFKEKVGVDKAVSWPAGTGAKGTAGVASAVLHTEGGLGYVESAYATLNHLTTVELKSHDGKFLKPTTAAFSAAAEHADWQSAKDFAVDMNNAPGANSWPIVSTTFVLMPKSASDAAKGAAVVKFFDWALANGDKAAEALQYIPLPAKIKRQVVAALKS